MALKSNFVWGWLALPVLLLAACKADSQDLPKREIALLQDGRQVLLTAEIAATHESREQGLMYRKSMADNAGMLFVWPGEGPLAFWMKNTPIPLDMLFLNSGKVVAVIPWAKPYDETPLDPGMPADMVLEVNGGWAGKQNIGVGALLRVSGTLPAATL